MSEAITFLDALVDSLRRAGRTGHTDELPPVAVFWPDGRSEWEALLPQLRSRRPVLTLGPYRPEEQTGPATWLRCMVARVLPPRLPEDPPPVLYLPGVDGQHLCDLQRCPRGVEVLADLRFRGVVWTHPNGLDWTIAAFLQRRDHGLSVDVRDDIATHRAMLRVLPLLATVPVARLREEAPWRASDFDALAGHRPGGQEPSIAEIIARGEGGTLEFKSSARRPVGGNAPDRAIEREVVKTVAAFLNSADGGMLLIGVADDGSIVGIEHDYERFAVKERDRDGYELWLTKFLLDAYGREFASYIRSSFHTKDGRTVCKADVAPAPSPVYFRDGKDDVFHIRAGNASQQLALREAVNYIRRRWS